MSKFVILVEDFDGDVCLVASPEDDEKAAVFKTPREARDFMRGDSDEYVKRWWVVDVRDGGALTAGLQIP